MICETTSGAASRVVWIRPDASLAVENDDESASRPERRDERLNAPSAPPRRGAGVQRSASRRIAGGEAGQEGILHPCQASRSRSPAQPAMSAARCSRSSPSAAFPSPRSSRSPPPASIGREVSFGDKTLKCKALEHYDFSDTDICLMSAGGAVSKEWSPKIGAKGCVVIDNSSAWRMDPDVPLIVPEVNAAAAKGFGKKNIIANPNCSTAQLVVALKPLHDRADDQAGGGRDLPVGLGRGQGRDGRALLADPGGVRVRSGRAEEVPQAHRLQRHSRISTSSWTTARPRKSGRWSPRPRRSSTRRSS